MPERIRLSRAKGARKPDGAVVVARPSTWGNPFRVGWDYMGDFLRYPDGVMRVARVAASPEVVVAMYRQWITEHPDVVAKARAELAGRDLGCWCRLDEPCHADVLLELANPGEPGDG